MPNHLSVGLAAGCVAPLRLERTSLKLYQWMGVDSLFVPDHYVGFIPRSVWGPDLTPAAKVIPTPDAFFDPFVMMGMMAERHRGVRIGTGVTEPLRRHPVTLAQAFVTLDHMTKGRAILGIGNGERENTEPYGVPFKQRVSRLEEALTIIRRLWQSNGEPVDFDGKFWTLRKALFATPLYNGKPPAIWVAAHAPRMLGLTARFADGWYPTQKMAPAEYAEKLARIRELAAQNGRTLAGFEPSKQILIALGSSRRAVLDQLIRVPAAAAMSMLLPGALWAKHGKRHPLGDDFEGFADFVPEEITGEQIAAARSLATADLLGDGIYAGSVDEIVADVRALTDAGLRHVVLWNMGPLASGASLGGLMQLGQLVRRLRKLPVV